MSDMLNTLVKLIRNQDELRAAVVARDALIVLHGVDAWYPACTTPLTEDDRTMIVLARQT